MFNKKETDIKVQVGACFGKLGVEESMLLHADQLILKVYHLSEAENGNEEASTPNLNRSAEGWRAGLHRLSPRAGWRLML